MGMFVYSALLPGVLILYINWYTEVIIYFNELSCSKFKT